MECPVCMQVYDQQLKIPRNLHCGHTICQQCINIVYKKKGGVTCHFCRFVHEPKFKAADFSKNYVASQIASKHRQKREKLQFCAEHKQPQQFFCEDQGIYFCIQCIVHHSGHHFIKQEYSVPLLKQKVSNSFKGIVEKRSQASLILDEHQKAKMSLKSSLVNEQASLDGQFDRLVGLLNKRRQLLKFQIQNYYDKQLQTICKVENKLIAFLKDLEEDERQLKICQEKLGKTKVIKNSEQLSEFQTHIHQAQDRLKQQFKFSQFQIDLPTVTFEKDLTNELQNLGQYRILVRPKICFFGERRKLLFYDIEKQNWFYVSLPTSTTFTHQLNYYSAAASFPTGEILITGGGASNSVYLVCFSDKTKISQRKSMLHCRKEHSCVYLAGHIYVISGYDGKNKSMNFSCQKYSLAKDEWVRTGDVNFPRCAFAAAAVSDRFIYIFGGFDGRQRMKSIEFYDIGTGVWSVLTTQLKQALSNSAAMSYKSNEIVILGGGYNQGFSHEVMRFNVSTNEFTEIALMSQGRDLRNKVIKYKGQFYAIGGNNYNGEKLNVRTGRWQSLIPYGSFVLDNLDSWCCALAFENEYRSMQTDSQEDAQ